MYFSYIREMTDDKVVVRGLFEYDPKRKMLTTNRSLCPDGPASFNPYFNFKKSIKYQKANLSVNRSLTFHKVTNRGKEEYILAPDTDPITKHQAVLFVGSNVDKIETITNYWQGELCPYHNQMISHKHIASKLIKDDAEHDHLEYMCKYCGAPIEIEPYKASGWHDLPQQLTHNMYYVTRSKYEQIDTIEINPSCPEKYMRMRFIIPLKRYFFNKGDYVYFLYKNLNRKWNETEFKYYIIRIQFDGVRFHKTIVAGNRGQFVLQEGPVITFPNASIVGRLIG